MFCPLCLWSLRDSLRKDLTPASELLAASSALHPHTCLEGSVSSQERTGTGEKTPYFLEGKQVKTAIRGLLLTKPMGIGRGQHCSPAPWGAGSQKGWCWKGQVQRGGNVQFMFCSEALISHSDQLCGNENMRR